MKQRDLLYEGKAKSVYRTEKKGRLIVRFRDDITAFDGGKKDVLQDKGRYNARVSAFFFEYLEYFLIVRKIFLKLFLIR